MYKSIFRQNIDIYKVTGHVGVSALKNFCTELFHPDHGSSDKNAIILQ